MTNVDNLSRERIDEIIEGLKSEVEEVPAEEEVEEVPAVRVVIDASVKWDPDTYDYNAPASADITGVPDGS